MFLLRLIIFYCFFITFVNAEPNEVEILNPSDHLKVWKNNSFEGETTYQSIVYQDALDKKFNKQVLHAKSDKSASAYYRKISIDITCTPTLSWSWRVDKAVYNDNPVIKQKTKEGDDFPARVYVVIKTGMLPWQSLALNYVWSNGAEMGESWPNPFTDKARMVVLRTSTDFGAWQNESRNVLEDFKKEFDVDVGVKGNEISGVAIMSDSDNTGLSSEAWFGGIYFQSNEQKNDCSK